MSLKLYIHSFMNKFVVHLVGFCSLNDSMNCVVLYKVTGMLFDRLSCFPYPRVPVG